MFNHLHSKTLADSRYFNGMMLVVLFTIFSMTYVTAVVAPQMGWWQYYAWRMECGDVLYRDIYLFMPPYFVFLTKMLYSLFHEHVMLYTLFVGLPVKLLCLLLIYTILCRITRPVYACICALLGGCMSATYMTDLLYDFNPITLLPCLLVAYTFLMYYERLQRGREARLMAFLTGFLLAVIFCLKQTFGITFAFTIGVMSVVICQKEKLCTFQQYANHIGLVLLGAIVGMLPAVVYLTVNQCWAEFFSCMASIVDAKGGTNHIFLRLILPFDNLKAWVYMLVIILLWQLQKRYWPISEQEKAPCSTRCTNAWTVFAVLLIFIGMVIYANMPADVHQTVAESGFVHKWHVRIFYLLTYAGIVAWCTMAIRYFMNKQVDTAILLFTSMITAHFFTGILSTDYLEEIYMIIYVPWMLAYAFKASCSFRIVKDVALLSIVCCLILTSISAKSDCPYSWQGWREPAVTHKNISSDIMGLEGLSMPPSVYQDFGTIVSLIKKYTKEDDKVLQFANIPLFNLITKRETPGYAPITWFDVCPDQLATSVAAACYAHPPKMVLWHNMNKSNWKAVEEVFRGGKRSGQREIQKFYEEVVRRDYRLVYKTYNHRDGFLELWLDINERHER